MGTGTIKVEWQKRIYGGYDAIAAECKGEYDKGDIVLQGANPKNPDKLPKQLAIVIPEPCVSQQL